MTLGVGILGAGIVSELYAQAIERGAPARFIGVYDPFQPRADALARRLNGRAFEVATRCCRWPRSRRASCSAPIMRTRTMPWRASPLTSMSWSRSRSRRRTTQSPRWRKRRDKPARICMPAHNYIYNPSVQRARRLLDEKRFGVVASYWIIYNIFHSEEVARRYGGVLREVAVHHAYSLLYLAGRPLNVSARTSRVHYKDLDAEDQVALCCETADGALANLWVSFAASDPTSDPWTVLYKILGEKGGVSFTWNDAIFPDAGGPAWGSGGTRTRKSFMDFKLSKTFVCKKRRGGVIMRGCYFTPARAGPMARRLAVEQKDRIDANLAPGSLPLQSLLRLRRIHLLLPAV